MSKFNVDAALKRLDEIAKDEYKTNYADAIDTPKEDLTVRRMARLAGIEMKFPFAEAKKMTGHTETGARQMWQFRGGLIDSKGKGTSEFKALKGTPSYELAFQVYQELKARNDPDTQYGFERFLQNCHAESNWFLAALRAAQPYLCGTAKGASKPAAEKKRREFWEVAKAAGDSLIDDGLKTAVEPVCALIIKVVPFLHFAPGAFTFGFSVVAVHYAKKGYCNLKIQDEIIQTLKLRSTAWENR